MDVPELSAAELSNRVLCASPALARQLYEIANMVLGWEAERRIRLDKKACSTLIAAGSLTLVATVIGLLGAPARSPAALAAVALFLGIASTFWQAGALRHNRYLALDERQIFNEAVLRTAQQSEPSVAYYHRTMAVYIWQLARANARTNDRKAIVVQQGQSLFAMGLVVGCAAGISLILTSMSWER